MTTFTVSTDPASKATRISGRSPLQSRASQDFGGLATAFTALTPMQKAGFQAAANTINAAEGRTGRRKLSAANAYTLLGSGRLAVGLPVQSTASTGAALNLPPALPRVLVNVTRTGSTFSVVLVPDFDVANPVQILCAPYQIAGKQTWPDSQFVPVGLLHSMNSDSNDITRMIASRFGEAQPGEELCLRLVATSTAGRRRGYVCVTGFCLGISAESAGTDDNANLHVA